MKNTYALQQEDFDRLLGLLSPDREEAGARYERMRAGLIRYFRFRGCDEPESLADETINRVASKASAFDSGRNVQLSTYFYGFASNILLEHRRRLKVVVPLESDHSTHEIAANVRSPEADPGSECLGECLGTLVRADREMLLKYYSREKHEKIEVRRRLAAELQCSPEVLHTRVFRLRSSLRACVKKCLDRAA
ncbi:MAG TPA: hypothetical protein VLI65_06650 [Pyrinomonadaceae bacterium]|nr:hypothetical protein [Pyrinomonadaceae bacterium]